MTTDKSIIRKRKGKEDPYARIANSLINDERLSWKGLGLLTYILSKPDDWQIMICDLIKKKTDGKKAVYSGINELIDLGYIVREQERGEKGRFGRYIYEVYEEPVEPKTQNGDTVDSPHTQKGDTEKRDADYRDTEKEPLLKTDSSNNEKRQKTEQNNNNQEQRPDVVVERLKSLFGTVTSKAIMQLHSLASDEDILNVASYVARQHNVRNPIGLLISLLEDGSIPDQTHQSDDDHRSQIEEALRQAELAKAEAAATSDSVPVIEERVEPVNPEQAELIWNQSRSVLEQKLSKPQFDTWFRPTHAVAYEANTLVVRVPNDFARDWIEGRLAVDVKQAVNAVQMRETAVKFVV